MSDIQKIFSNLNLLLLRNSQKIGDLNQMYFSQRLFFLYTYCQKKQGEDEQIDGSFA